MKRLAIMLATLLVMTTGCISVPTNPVHSTPPISEADSDVTPPLIHLPSPVASGWGASDVTIHLVDPPLEEAPIVPACDPCEEAEEEPEIESDWALARALATAVGEAMADFTGTYSVVVQELDSGNRWVRGGKATYHPASTIKMPVTLYALDQHLAGKLGWQDLITYTEQDFESPGGGAFETAPFRGLYPVENLINRALRYSNNVAVNMLGRHLGWENIRAFTRTIDGELFREEDGTPAVTALSELGWWLHLYRLSQEEPGKAELLLVPLGEVTYHGRIAAGLPDGVPHLHKFGSLEGHYHDGGIIFSERPYVVVIMTHGADEGEADLSIARASAAIYRVMTEFRE